MHLRVSWKVIEDNELDLNYHSFTFGTFGTFGAFGSGTWKVVKKVCDPETHPHAHGDYDPWNAPDPKRDVTLTLGFQSCDFTAHLCT